MRVLLTWEHVGWLVAGANIDTALGMEINPNKVVQKLNIESENHSQSMPLSEFKSPTSRLSSVHENDLAISSQGSGEFKSSSRKTGPKFPRTELLGIAKNIV